jgi:cytochrome c oxidase cbb3-type subunit 3
VSTRCKGRWRLLPLLAILAVGCDFPGRPDPAERPVPSDQVMDFGVLYSQNCSGCHGSDGKLGPAPPLNDPLFRAIVPEEEVHGIISSGRKKTLMPAFAKENGGVLTAAQIQVLVKEIKGIPYKIDKQEAGVTKAVLVSPKWGTPAKPPKDAPRYREPVGVPARAGGPPAEAGTPTPNAGDKKKGAIVFARACAICHGSRGQDPELTINDGVFLGLMSNQALRRYVITGRSDLGMPGYAEPRPDTPHFVPLTDQDVADVVALLASWRSEK